VTALFRNCDRLPAWLALFLTCSFASSALPQSQSSGEPQRSKVALEALTRLQGIDLNTNPSLKAAVYKLLDQTRGTAEFVQIVKQLRLQDQDDALLEIASRNPSADFGVEAIRLVLGNSEGTHSIKQFLERTNAVAVRGAVEALGNAAENKSVPILLSLIKDSKRDLNCESKWLALWPEQRKVSVRS